MLSVQKWNGSRGVFVCHRFIRFNSTDLRKSTFCVSRVMTEVAADGIIIDESKTWTIACLMKA